MIFDLSGRSRAAVNAAAARSQARLDALEEQERAGLNRVLDEHEKNVRVDTQQRILAALDYVFSLAR
jgi:hypothetical protein